MNSKRGQWASNLGFILAAAGSAVGLGNIWKFPGKIAAYGGGAFLLLYVLNFAMFIGDNPSNVWLVMAAFAISFIVSAVLTVVFGFDENR